MGSRVLIPLSAFLCRIGFDPGFQPAEDVVEAAFGVEAVVALELGGDVRRVGVIEKDDADGLDDAVGFIDAVADVVGLAGGSEAGAG